MRLLLNSIRKIGLLRSCGLFLIGLALGAVIKSAYHSAISLIPEPIPIKLKDRSPLPRIPTL
jgi:hypothetical protein